MKLNLILIIILLSNLCLSQNCLRFNRTIYNKVEFNPAWIAKEKIYEIEESQYSDSTLNKIKSKFVYLYDTSGYIFESHYFKIVPIVNEGNEEYLQSKRNYIYEYRDSFLFQKHNTTEYFKSNQKLDSPKLNGTFISNIYNIFSLSKFNDGVSNYQYDKFGNLIKEFNKDNTIEIFMDYNQNDIIKLKENYSKLPEYNLQAFFLYNSHGLIEIIKTSKNEKYRFHYNKNGDLNRQDIILNGKIISSSLYVHKKRN